jgi:hypothetical protein
LAIGGSNNNTFTAPKEKTSNNNQQSHLRMKRIRRKCFNQLKFHKNQTLDMTLNIHGQTFKTGTKIKFQHNGTILGGILLNVEVSLGLATVELIESNESKAAGFPTEGVATILTIPTRHLFLNKKQGRKVTITKDNTLRTCGNQRDVNRLRRSQDNPLYEAPVPVVRQHQNILLKTLETKRLLSSVTKPMEELPEEIQHIYVKHSKWYKHNCKQQSIQNSGLGIQPRHPLEHFKRIITDGLKSEGIIYAIVSIEPRDTKATTRVQRHVYVGQTFQAGLMDRWMQHIHASKNINTEKNRSATHLHSAMNKFGLETFVIMPLEYLYSKVDADDKENFWMRYLNSVYPDGLNAKYEKLATTPRKRGSRPVKKKLLLRYQRATGIKASINISSDIKLNMKWQKQQSINQLQRVFISHNLLAAATELLKFTLG